MTVQTDGGDSKQESDGEPGENMYCPLYHQDDYHTQCDDSRSLLCSSLIWSPFYRPWRISSECRLSLCTVKETTVTVNRMETETLTVDGKTYETALAWCIFDLAASIMAVNSALWFAPSLFELLFCNQTQYSINSKLYAFKSWYKTSSISYL